MRKLVAGAVTAAALIAAAPAGAQPGNGNGNGGNGCGWLFKELAAPGFGQAVAEVAREGGFNEAVDLFCRNELP